jgi:hypothetical protein
MEKAYHKLQKFCTVFRIPIWCTNVMHVMLFPHLVKYFHSNISIYFPQHRAHFVIQLF